jgi:antitoxin component YwqK of YwqJK toxin-antitoxin module
MVEADEPPGPADGVVVHRRGDGSAEETPFTNGVIDGEVKSYRPEGGLLRVARFKVGRLDGETVEFAADGSLAARFNFADGRLNGPATVY